MLVCSQNRIRSKIPLCLVIRLRGRSLFREPSKSGDPNHTGQASQGPLVTTTGRDIERPLKVVGAPRVLIAAKVGHKNGGVTCCRILRRVAPRIAVMQAARTRHGPHRCVR
jgi:hypothetical protein